MSIRTWIRMSRVRRGLAAGAVVLATGGLVLARTPEGAQLPKPAAVTVTPGGQNTSSFSGPGAHGTFSLSHTKVMAGSEQRVFAELVLKADPVAQAIERAPLSMVVVLDTSGSMAGEKIDQAKQSVIQLIRDLRDDDEIAFVRYSTDSELIQPLARAGRVRGALIAKIEGLSAGGGTNIAPALSQGALALSDAGAADRLGSAAAGARRVRRVILASDGLDGTRARSESVARESADRGITVSSMGIGLDFDESYMGAVAQAGHGNFAFVKDASSLATFLQRELKETASTTVERASARITLPTGVRFVRAGGAEAKVLGSGNEVELSMGALFAGDERRVVLELAADLDPDVTRSIAGQVSWDRVGGDAAQARIDALSLAGSVDARAVEEGRDPAIYASAMSVIASRRQLEAAQAYQQGDEGRARALIEQNVAELKVAAAAAPAPAATAILNQMREYETTKKTFAAAKPRSAAGNAAAKSAVQKDLDNLSRSAF